MPQCLKPQTPVSVYPGERQNRLTTFNRVFKCESGLEIQLSFWKQWNCWTGAVSQITVLIRCSWNSSLSTQSMPHMRVTEWIQTQTDLIFAGRLKAWPPVYLSEPWLDVSTRVTPAFNAYICSSKHMERCVLVCFCSWCLRESMFV